MGPGALGIGGAAFATVRTVSITADTRAERRTEIAAITAALSAGRGVVLSGDAGIGKSYVAATIAARWAAEDGCVVRAHASVGATELPLGPFVGFLHRPDAPLLSLFAEVRERLLELAAGRRLLLVVDDIPLLDESSTALVQHFVTEGRALLLCTMRRGVYPPAEIADLLQRGLLRRVEVGPLDRDAIRSVAARLLGTPIDDGTADRLATITGGNPLFLREVVVASMEERRVVVTAGVASIHELPASSPRLVDIVRDRLGHLPHDDSLVLSHLAFAEPCGPGELSHVADLDTLGRLESAGLITTSSDGMRLGLRLAHPLYGEVLRQSTGLLQRRAILASLARDLQATGARRRADTVKLARLAVDGGVDIDVATLNQATAICIHSGHLELAERIGRRVMERSTTSSPVGTWPPHCSSSATSSR